MEGKHKIGLDIVKLARIIIDDKKKMGIYCGVAAVIAIIVAFSIPRIYKSSIMLAPEETSSGFSGNISSLASMVGMNMKFGDSGDAIYPEIYPDAMESTTFLVSLFPVKVSSKNGEIKDMPYSDYLEKHQKHPWWEYPGVLIRKLIKFIKGPDTAGNSKEIDPCCLTKEQSELAGAISGNIKCHVDKKTNVISITVTDQDALIAKTMVDTVTAHLQDFITNYRTNKARNDEAYMKQLFNEAKQQYDEARRKYASYSDANAKVVLQSVQSRIDDLENEMQLRYNIFTQVTEQLQMAKAKVQERTPAFTTLQNSTVPVKHSNMPKVFILILFLILAFLLRGAILVKRHHKEIITFQ